MTTNRPEYGKQYRLTGGPKTTAISNGNTWAESEVKETVFTATNAAIVALRVLDGFIGNSERCTLIEDMRGEEKDFFFDMIAKLGERIKTMPKTYDQDGLGDKAVVYLHYFKGGADWFITEKDAETPEEPGQRQAFGLADLFHDGGELGYISIAELLKNGVELDLYWTPKTLGEAKSSRAV